MRKLLWAWIRGPLERLQSKLVTEISSRLLLLKVSFPDEFLRKPRGLDELKAPVSARWKATELRSFLLYSGPETSPEETVHAFSNSSLGYSYFTIT